MPNIKQNITAYSALATAFLASNAELDAQVLYTDVDPDILLDEDFDKSDIDLNQDGTGDIRLIKNTFSTSFPYPVSSVTYQIWYGLNMLRVKVNGENSLQATYGSYGNAYPLALDEGDLISEDQSWVEYSQQFLMQGIDVAISTESGFSYTFGYTYGYWQPGEENKYLGVKLKVDKQIYYGWVRLSITDDGNILLKDYAVNMNAGASIDAGQTESPVMLQTLTENSVSAFAYSHTLYVQIHSSVTAPVTASVLDMNGKVVYDNFIHTGNTKIELHHPPGIYVLRLQAGDEVYMKKIQIQ